VAAVPLPPAPEVAPQPPAPLRPLAQAEVVPAVRVHRVRVLMLATARRVLGRSELAPRARQVRRRRSELAPRAHQMPRRWVLACHSRVRLALAQH